MKKKQNIQKKIENLINDEILKEMTVNKDIPFTSQGIDSIDMMILYVNIEESFNISLEDIYTKEILNLKELVDYVSGKVDI